MLIGMTGRRQADARRLRRPGSPVLRRIHGFAAPACAGCAFSDSRTAGFTSPLPGREVRSFGNPDPPGGAPGFAIAAVRRDAFSGSPACAGWRQSTKELRRMYSPAAPSVGGPTAFVQPRRLCLPGSTLAASLPLSTTGFRAARRSVVQGSGSLAWPTVPRFLPAGHAHSQVAAGVHRVAPASRPRVGVRADPDRGVRRQRPERAEVLRPRLQPVARPRRKPPRAWSPASRRPLRWRAGLRSARPGCAAGPCHP